MATTFRSPTALGFTGKKIGMNQFDAYAELQKHAWHPRISMLEAEKLLVNKSAYTYLVRTCTYDQGYMITFVTKEGEIAHDHFTLIDSTHGLWRNGNPKHVGQLGKVLRDMMHCSMDEGQPL